jgi:hypothetical protein
MANNREVLMPTVSAMRKLSTAARSLAPKRVRASDNHSVVTTTPCGEKRPIGG